MELSESQIGEYFLDISQELLVVLNREGKIEYINSKGVEILEENEDLVGKDWFDNYYDKNVNQEVKSVFLDLVKGNIEFSEFFENRIVSRKGNQLIMSWHNKAIYDDQGKICYVISAGKNITKEQNYSEKFTQATTALELVMEKMKSSSV